MKKNKKKYVPAYSTITSLNLIVYYYIIVIIYYVHDCCTSYGTYYLSAAASVENTMDRDRADTTWAEVSIGRGGGFKATSAPGP